MDVINELLRDKEISTEMGGGGGENCEFNASYLGPASGVGVPPSHAGEGDGTTAPVAQVRGPSPVDDSPQKDSPGDGGEGGGSRGGGGGGGGGSGELPTGGAIIVGEGSSKKEFRRCVICQDVTERRHLNYGADACFSCRAFFRRTHQKRQPPSFECKSGGDCEVTARTRRRCQSCRYDRCLRAGMRPEFVMDEEQRRVRMEKCRRKREERRGGGGGGPEEDQDEGTGEVSREPLNNNEHQHRGGGGRGGGGGSARGRKRARKRAIKSEPDKGEVDEDSQSYLLQLAEVAARQAASPSSVLGGGGGEGASIKQEEEREEEGDRGGARRDFGTPLTLGQGAFSMQHHMRQRWNSATGDLTSQRGGAEGPMDEETSPGDHLRHLHLMQQQQQQQEQHLAKQKSDADARGVMTTTTLQLRQQPHLHHHHHHQHMHHHLHRHYSVDQDSFFSPHPLQHHEPWSDGGAGGSPSQQQWRNFVPPHLQAIFQDGQQQQQALPTQQQHNGGADSEIPERWRGQPSEDHDESQQQQQPQQQQPRPSPDRVVADIERLLSTDGGGTGHGKEKRQRRHEEEEMEEEELDNESATRQLESKVSLLTAELEVAQRVAKKRNLEQACCSSNSSNSSILPKAQLSLGSVLAGACCQVCGDAASGVGDAGDARHGILSAWHSAVSDHLSPDPDLLQGLIVTHQGGTLVQRRQVERHLERLREFLLSFHELAEKNKEEVGGGAGGEDPEAMGRRADLVVRYATSRYVGSMQQDPPPSAASQLQWLLLCQLPAHVTKVLGMSWLSPEQARTVIATPNQQQQRYERKFPSVFPDLPFRALPLLAYLVLSDPQGPFDGAAGILAAKLRSSAREMNSSSSSWDGEDSFLCGTCCDSRVLLETLDCLFGAGGGGDREGAAAEGDMGEKKVEEGFVSKHIARVRDVFRHVVPFDDELLKDFVMYTLDVPISRSFAIKGVTNLADRFCAIIRGHDGMEHLSDESELIHLLESGAVFRGAALSLLHCYALPDGASQLRFCLGQEGEPDEEKVGWRKYESMVGGRPFKKVALREINDKSKVLEPKNMERYSALMEHLHAMVPDGDTYRLLVLAAVFRHEKDFGTGAAAVEAAALARERYWSALARRSAGSPASSSPTRKASRSGGECVGGQSRTLASALEEAMPALEELARIIRSIIPPSLRLGPELLKKSAQDFSAAAGEA